MFPKKSEIDKALQLQKGDTLAEVTRLLTAASMNAEPQFIDLAYCMLARLVNHGTQIPASQRWKFYFYTSNYDKTNVVGG